MPLCRSCDKPVKWAKTLGRNKSVPLDPTPVPTGSYIIVEYGARGVPIVRALHQGENPRVPRYMPHFATCPNAKKHRKEKP